MRRSQCRAAPAGVNAALPTGTDEATRLGTERPSHGESGVVGARGGFWGGVVFGTWLPAGRQLLSCMGMWPSRIGMCRGIPSQCRLLRLQQHVSGLPLMPATGWEQKSCVGPEKYAPGLVPVRAAAAAGVGACPRGRERCWHSPCCQQTARLLGPQRQGRFHSNSFPCVVYSCCPV